MLARKTEQDSAELMEIAFHIGANFTDEDKLLRTLLRNGDSLAKQGIKVPGPGKYRALIRETIQGLNGKPPPGDTRDILLDAILDEQTPERLVLSHPMIICIANRIFDNGVFYEQTEFKIKGFRDLFPEDEIELFMGIRNPATWLPRVYGDSKADTFEGYLKGFDPRDIRWSDIVRRIRHAAPDATLTVWCNEDTPMIWGDLVREMAGLGPADPVEGAHDLLGDIMRPQGLARFEDFLAQHPPENRSQRSRIMEAFLDKFADPDAIIEEITLPELAPHIEGLTRTYEEDVALIADMSDVRFLAP